MGFGGMGFGGMGFGGFDDDDFGGGGFASFSSSSFGGGGGMGTSMKQTSYMDEHGNMVTRTEKTTVDRNGQKKTEITEQVKDRAGRITHQSTGN
jgi:hypothetical protein